MRIEWDAHKNEVNIGKHGVSFELAQHVFDDPLQLSILEKHEYGEGRWQTLGRVSGGLLILLVAHTVIEADEEVIRIISARKATKHERQDYEEIK